MQPAVIAAVAVAAAVAAYLLRRRIGAGGRQQDAPSGPRDWQCECGQEFRVSGEGRHTVFWLAEAGPDDPVLGDVCPNCDRELLRQL